MDLRFSEKQGYVVRTGGTGSTLGDVGFLVFSTKELAQRRIEIEEQKTGLHYYYVPATLTVKDPSNN